MPPFASRRYGRGMSQLSRTQWRNDAVLALALFVGGLISAALSTVSGLYGEQRATLPLALVYMAALAAPIAARRRWPATVAVVVSVAYFVAVTIRIPEVYVGNIVMFIALYTVGAWSDDRRRAKIVRISIIAGMFLWLLVTMFRSATTPPEDQAAEMFSRAGAFSPYVATLLMNLLINVLYFAGAYYFGERAHTQRVERRVLEERTAELERERERTAAQAVALDRVRIARELHDVVAHHVSLMGVHAGAARAVMAKDPDQARSILESVESSARESLRELRQLLSTLRADGVESEPDAAPTTHDLEDLPRLIEEANAAGMPTTFAVFGDRARVPQLVQVNLYRIAQEALTNARRHAGPSATADVRLRYAANDVELEVTNTGRSAPVSPGLGLLGMRERASASGGEIEIRPRSQGEGFLVRVRVPLSERTSLA